MCAAVGEVAPPGCAHRVTIVVTTSPIPARPGEGRGRACTLCFPPRRGSGAGGLCSCRSFSPAAFRDHLPGLEECGRLLVCDGYLRGDGKAQLCPEAAYAEYLDEVVLLAEGGALGPCRVLRLQERRGYSLALAAALEAVETEFVLVVQHDWLFVRPAEVAAAVAAMDLDAEVRYIGMQSMTTLDYPRRIRDRYGLELPPARVVGGLRLVPQLHWYDKPHLPEKKPGRRHKLSEVRADSSDRRRFLAVFGFGGPRWALGPSNNDSGGRARVGSDLWGGTRQGEAPEAPIRGLRAGLRGSVLRPIFFLGPLQGRALPGGRLRGRSHPMIFTACTPAGREFGPMCVPRRSSLAPARKSSHASENERDNSSPEMNSYYDLALSGNIFCSSAAAAQPLRSGVLAQESTAEGGPSQVLRLPRSFIRRGRTRGPNCCRGGV
ncbi:unnamed protein product [Prorocentrum cordatum]|uniref:Uncharacterized protein n=1 Tax=Prorocentrum cordatum TaxID=2364126 RepID=A0ABN9U636_9DINO|nr:unnamed protein product [Polarella glacialis]